VNEPRSSALVEFGKFATGITHRDNETSVGYHSYQRLTKPVIRVSMVDTRSDHECLSHP
jgi:hypothetical protein